MEQICVDCGKKFLNAKKLSDHMRNHDKTILQCKECGKEVIGNKKLISHMEVHKLISCNKCGYEVKANSITAHKA